MSDATSNDAGSGDAENPDAPIGEMLRTARKKHKLSIEDVAQELHLDDEIITALENGERTKLPAQIFVQGYLKSYARLVGLPAEELLNNYSKQAGEPPPLSVISTSARLPSIRLRSLKLVRNIIIFLLVALALWMVWPLAERIIESRRDSITGQEPGRLELPPASEYSGNDS